MIWRFVVVFRNYNNTDKNPIVQRVLTLLKLLKISKRHLNRHVHCQQISLKKPYKYLWWSAPKFCLNSPKQSVWLYQSYQSELKFGRRGLLRLVAIYYICVITSSVRVSISKNAFDDAKVYAHEETSLKKMCYHLHVHNKPVDYISTSRRSGFHVLPSYDTIFLLFFYYILVWFYSLVFESTVFFSSHSPYFCLLISIPCVSKVCFWVLILETPFTPVHPHPASTTV